jgi:very-short-patch-repair endonuclease
MVHVTDPVPLEDQREIEGIPVTSPERTLIDLAAVEGFDRLEDALDSALRKRLTTLRRLQLRIRTESGRKGVAKLRKLLADRDADGQPSESRFETRLNRLLLDNDLPPTRQYKIWNGGSFVARVDFCFVDAKVIVEADGYRWHSSRRAWQRDRARRNELTAMGWQVIQLTWEDVTRYPNRTVERLRCLLQPRLPLPL